jgi:hypothetical protein
VLTQECAAPFHSVDSQPRDFNDEERFEDCAGMARPMYRRTDFLRYTIGAPLAQLLLLSTLTNLA